MATRSRPASSANTIFCHGLLSLLCLLCAAVLPACAAPREAPATSAAPTSARTPAPPVSAPATDAEWSAFVPAGARLRLGARGDLDGDGDEDALIVLETDGDAAAAAPRALLLLRRDAGGVLRKALENPNAILCRSCGGMMGDPLEGIRIGRGEFALRFEGGSRELWSSEFRFVYRPAGDDWRLAEVRVGGFDRADGQGAARTRTPAQLGDVSLIDFDPADFPADALP